MIDQMFQSEITKNLDDQQRRPGPVVAPQLSTFQNVGAGAGGFVAGPLQAAAAYTDIGAGIGQTTQRLGLRPVNDSGLMTADDFDSAAEQQNAAAGEVNWNSPIGPALRTKAKDFMPDPQSTGKAGMILGSLSDFASQAVPLAFAGPAGLVALGAARGVQKAEDLKEQGVDVNTRTAAGAVSGALDAASMLLPMTGATRVAAAVKGAAGGAGLSIVQTEAEKLILQSGGYDKMASTYDPFDPVSIALSALVPAAFGGLHAPVTAKAPGAARAEPTHADVALSPQEQAHSDAVEASTIDVDIASLQKEIAGQTDASSRAVLETELARLQKQKAEGPAKPLDPDVDAAARVTQTAAALDRSRLTPADDLVGLEQHEQAVQAASDQIARGESVEVSDIVDTDRVEAARANAMRDRLNDTSSLLPAADDEHIAKLAPEAQEQLHGMYADAAREKGGFDATLGHLADEVGGKVMSAPLKGTARATAKIISDYEGNPGRIKDLLRATIEVHSADAASRVIAGIRERYGISGERNLLDPGKTPVDGYRDAKFNVDVNGHTAEIQVNMPQMMAAKKIAHKFYEEREAITRESNARGEKVLPAEVDDLNAKMRAIYEPAWVEALAATSERNSASEIGAPLRRAESEGNDRGAGGSQATQRDGPTPAPSDTGIPSTSKNSARGGNLAGRESGADFIGTSDESLHLDAIASAADEILRSNPDLMVQLDGMDHPMRAEDLLNAVREAAAEESKGGSLLEVAAQCAISL